MSKFKQGDRVVVYGACMYEKRAHGNAASRRVGVVCQEPGKDKDDLKHETEFMTVKFDVDTYQTVSVNPKQCRKVARK